MLETEAKKLVETLTEEGGSHDKLESQVGPSPTIALVMFSSRDMTGGSLQVSPGTNRDDADQSPGFSGGCRVRLET